MTVSCSNDCFQLVVEIVIALFLYEVRYRWELNVFSLGYLYWIWLKDVVFSVTLLTNPDELHVLTMSTMLDCEHRNFVNDALLSVPVVGSHDRVSAACCLTPAR